ncbi:Acyltransferase family protein [Paraburkholderia steynii]|uniref:Acyltransferase family protein n=2 Tax=Paraburkholderia steynii TaxID=1245441 RepID=A0A7Z7B9T6_9BURK|nr:Acyltransferase family protein [Paraburkholderia steynii]
MLARGNNNFDLVRLIAALLVMYGHAGPVYHWGGNEDLVRLTTGFDYAGSIAVYAFFMISGILVSMSYQRQRSIINFAALRVARIFPALVVAVTAITFIVGPLVSIETARTYFLNPQIYKWWYKTATLVTGVGTYLPGVFTTVNLKMNVDAPVWTLPMELKCYFLVMCIGLLGLLRTRVGTLAAGLVGLGWWYFMYTHPDAYYFGDFILKMTYYSFFRFCVF